MVQFIYLLTPFVGGLFGALSHEYIDFTSLRNRNKQLHLRRSFYSLDNLQQTGQIENQPNGLDVMGLSVVTKESSSSGSLRSLAGASSILTFNNNFELPSSIKTTAGGSQISLEACNNK